MVKQFDKNSTELGRFKPGKAVLAPVPSPSYGHLPTMHILQRLNTQLRQSKIGGAFNNEFNYL